MVYKQGMTVKAKIRDEGKKLFVESGGRSCTLVRPGDLESIWEELSDETAEEHIPYWTELWPASLALAEWLEECADELENRSLLDMGCGLGFLSLLAKGRGARVLGMDLEADALFYASQNAALNGQKPSFIRMDWGQPSVRVGAFERIIASDILYEARFREPLAAFLAHSLAKDGIAWIADPCRSFFAGFVEVLAKRSLGARVAAEKIVGAELTASIPIRVKIWQIAFFENTRPEGNL